MIRNFIRAAIFAPFLIYFLAISPAFHMTGRPMAVLHAGGETIIFKRAAL